ncbi:MAG: NAD-dependent epimerase/dehydratase family protein [Persicimonas sp.]
MNILITGAAGFIGSACAVGFLRRGDDVIIVDSFESTLYERSLKEDNLAWVKSHGEVSFYEDDIRERDAMEKIFEAHDVDLVVHLAAVAGVRPSIENAPLYYDINVTGTATLIEVARARGVEDFVLASSSSVYGGNEKTPFAESDPVDSPISPYAASKRALELLARTDQHLHGGNISCLRFFTVYGPRQRPEMAIHKFMRLLDDGESIPMFGDGTSGRDYTYIDDIVQGVVAAAERLDGFRIYNLGGDRVTHLKELIDTIGEVLGVEPDIEQLPMQPGDVDITNADLTRSRTELGYDPQTSIREGIEEMWAWYQQK